MIMKKFVLLPFCLLFATTFVNAQSDEQARAVVAVDDVLLITEGSRDPKSPNKLDLYTAGYSPDEIHADEGIVIWPIPVGEKLHIYCETCSPGNLPFEIIDLTGKVVLRGSVLGGELNLIELEGARGVDHVLRLVDGRSVRAVTFRKATI
jgi:hypothetical protein